MTRTRRAASIVGIVTLIVGCSGDAPGDGGGDGVARQVRGTAGSTDRAVRTAQRCDAPDASVIIDSAGIGPVLRGARISALLSRCAVKDTTLVSEGMNERGHLIPVGERLLTVLTTGTPDTSIIRVTTQDRRFRTVGGVGVGSSVQALRLAHGSICAARAEGEFVVMAADLPGVSFAIDWNPPPSREPSAAETPFPGGDPGTSLDDARITKAWVHGVSGACRVGVG